MITEQSKWDSLWDLFEKLTNSPKEKHKEILSSRHISKELKKELEELLAAHYSQSHLLDQQPNWQNDFNQAFEPPKLIHGYTIENKLGSGGVGEVYLACKAENGFNRKVAIKFATTGRYSDHILKSFNTELEVLLSLNHANIERLYDGGITKDNIPYLIVEHIDGLNIDQYCEKNKLTLKQRLLLFKKVCSAVDAVHRSLIVHRDIKASNIMVTKKGEPKLLDFGLAKLYKEDSNKNSDETTVSSQMMTLAYASPEQINAATITTASDIYSLGVLLYYLITGKLPYKIKQDQLVSTYKTITEQQVILASKNTNNQSEIYRTEPRLSKKLGGDLEQIAAKAISKKPERRYLSASQLSDDIENYLSNRPVIAKPDLVLYRLGKFVQRHKIGVALSFISIVSLVYLSLSLFIKSTNLKETLVEVKQEQKRVLQVTEFLKNIFKTSDPLLTDKKIVKVKELLDYSSQQLETQFNDEKQTKATLFLTLGNVYLNMSELKQAEAMFLKSTEYFEKENDETGVLKVQLAQVRLLQQQGKLKQAQTKITALFKNKSIKRTPLVEAEIEVLYGQSKYKLGDLKQAEKILKSALKKRIVKLGEEHVLAVNIYLLLGNVYWRMGEFDKVQVQYQKAHSINIKMYGEKNHKTLKSRSSLGVLAYARGNHKEALNHMSFVASARLQKLGKNHVLTAEAFNRLGAIYYEIGDYFLAQQKLQLAKESFISLKLNKSLKFAKTLNNLGLVERQNRLYKSANETFLEAKKIEMDILGENHEDIAAMNNNLGMTAADLGEIDKALLLFKKAYANLYKNHGANNVNLAFSMTNIGRMYLQKQELKQARVWLDKALILRKEKLGDENLYYIESLSALAEIDIQNKHIKSANEKLIRVLEIRMRKLPKDDWRTSEAKALFSLTLISQNPRAKNDYYCNLKKISNLLGEEHYRVRMLIDKQRMFNLTPQLNFNPCEKIKPN